MTPYNMLNKNRILILALLLLCGLGGIYIFSRFIFFGEKRLTPQAAAELTPIDAEIMAFVPSDTDEWSQLNNYGSPEFREQIQTNLQRFQQEAQTLLDIDYEEDIEPWLGNMAFSYFPSRNSFLAIGGITDASRARDFIQSFQEQESVTIVELEYKENTITEVQAEGVSPFYLARVDGYLLLSPHQEILETAIDVSQGRPSFAQSIGFKEVLSQELTLNNPIAQVYLPNRGRILRDMLVPELPREFDTELDKIKSVVTGIRLKEDGIHIQTIANLDPNADFPDFQPSDNELLAKLPEDSIAVINGNGFNNVWSALLTYDKRIGFWGDDLERLHENLLQDLGFNLNREGFGWMDKEYAMTLVPTVKSSFPDVPLGVAAWTQSSQPEIGKEGLEKLSQLKDEGYSWIELETTTVGNVEVTNWVEQYYSSADRKMLLFSHGWLEEDILTGTYAMPFNEVSEVEKNQSIEQNSDFTAVTEALPEDNFGYVYLDVKEGLEILETANEQLLTRLPRDVQVAIGQVNQVGITASKADTDFAQIDIIFSVESISGRTNSQ